MTYISSNHCVLLKARRLLSAALDLFPLILSGVEPPQVFERKVSASAAVEIDMTVLCDTHRVFAPSDRTALVEGTHARRLHR